MVEKLKMAQQCHLAPICIVWLCWFDIWEKQRGGTSKKMRMGVRPRRPTRQSTIGVGTKSSQRHGREDQNGTTTPSSTYCHGLALLVWHLGEAKGRYEYKNSNGCVTCGVTLEKNFHWPQNNQPASTINHKHSKHILDNQPLLLSEKFFKLVAMLVCPSARTSWKFWETNPCGTMTALWVSGFFCLMATHTKSRPSKYLMSLPAKIDF
jgi:hypothetical protein